MARKRVAVLISGRGSNMRALIKAAKAKNYPARVALVISNEPAAEGLAHARRAGIPTLAIDHRGYGKDREAFERAIQAELERYAIDLVCLAGFMRLLTPWFVSRWSGRLLNIHPALLPAFKGLDTHARALAAGVKIHGATVHFVVPEVDSGPIIAQAAVPVSDTDTPETLAARVLKLEHRIYPLALKLVALGRVRIVDGRCVIAKSAPPTAALIVPKAR
ncbi:MAG TPA: phosphoribosylglycinamide formyltransferase [Xanthobacteraceae bacterium]|nr:phosphoribosylglycinamide formyltransferase [Xanthobacteraceae bacterium]